jgi:hypothetical protein
MTKREAYKIGAKTGVWAAKTATVLVLDAFQAECECRTYEKASDDEAATKCAACLAVAAREYADSHETPLQHVEAYDAGVAAGIAKGVKARLAGGAR